MRDLVVMTGPIGAGKSTVAALLAKELSRARRSVAVADLDDIAFSQAGAPDVAELWRRAGMAHAALVSGWFAAGVDAVIAHGPFFESRSYGALFASAPAGVRAQHVLLRVSYEEALRRVTSDPGRDPHALSRNPDFLRSTHDAFRSTEACLPPVDVECDTTDTSAEDAARRVASSLFGPEQLSGPEQRFRQE